MNPRSILTLSNFFASAHFFLIIYIITPYLATFLPDSETGLVVSLGALITLSVFPFMPELVRHYGARRLAMFFARYWIIIPVLAIAGSLAKKKIVPVSPGTLPTDTPLFVFFLVSVVIIVGALTFIPALALGPIVEHLMMVAA